MLEAILDSLNNYFVKTINRGGFTIASGTVDLPEVKNGQYIKIIGSDLNDGVYQYPVEGLKDESFTGEIWYLAIPKAVLDLSTEITDWVAKNPATNLTSESFGGYAAGYGTNPDGTVQSWQAVYRSRLNRWRKV